MVKASETCFFGAFEVFLVELIFINSKLLFCGGPCLPLRIIGSGFQVPLSGSLLLKGKLYLIGDTELAPGEFFTVDDLQILFYVSFAGFAISPNSSKRLQEGPFAGKRFL